MRSEMCSLHLTHPSVHTWSSGQPTVQRPGSSRGLPVGAGIKLYSAHRIKTIHCMQMCNISCWLELLNYSPNGGNGNVQCFSSLLTYYFLFDFLFYAFFLTSYFVKLNNLLLHIRTIFFVFFPMINWLWPLFLIFIFQWNRKSWLDNFIFLVTLLCLKNIKKYSSI